MDPEDSIIDQIEQSASLIKGLRKQKASILKIADALATAFRRGNKVVLFGNGGSAADAQHIACELQGKFYRQRAPLPAIALTTNTSILTAIANDYGYEEVFARQVKALVKSGDIAIGISTSGNSPNVILAISEAKKSGATTVAFTGIGGKLSKAADYTLSVPSRETPRIQEAHITMGHVICSLVEDALFGLED